MTSQNSSRGLSDHLSFLLAQLGFETSYRFSDAVAPLGILPRHHGVLRLLDDRDGQTQQELGAQLNIHRNVMVGLIDELERRGLVERRRHPADRRAHAVHLLPAAYEVLDGAQAIADDLDEIMFGSLSTDDRAALMRLLTQVADDAGLRPGVHPGFARRGGLSKAVPDADC